MGDLNVRQYVRHDGTIVVELCGELDTHADASLQDLFATLLEAHETPCLTVDLRQITFIDSAGIRALAVGDLAARASGATFRLCNAKPMIEDRLRLAGILGRRAV